MKQNLKDAEAVYINADGVEVYVTGMLKGDTFFFCRDKYIDFGWELVAGNPEYDDVIEAGYTHGWHLIPNTNTFFFDTTEDKKEITEGKVQLKTNTQETTTKEEEGRYYKVMLGDRFIKYIYTKMPNYYQETLAEANAIIELGLPDVTSDMLWNLQPDLSTYRVEIDIKATHKQEAVYIAEEMLTGMRDKHTTEFNGQLIQVS